MARLTPAGLEQPPDCFGVNPAYWAKRKAHLRAAMDFCHALLLSCNMPPGNAPGTKQASHVQMPDLSSAEREAGAVFAPKFDEKGLLSAIAIDATTRDVLMVAFMDAEALAKTRETGLAHFHSRSRGRLWMKGETSGHVLKVEEIRVDCDQDALVLVVRPEGPACHTGETSCFYRRLDGDALSRIE
jgi:phosphoribosyl-AMP cyclohydrolase